MVAKEEARSNNASKLVQTTLTSAFFSPRKVDSAQDINAFPFLIKPLADPKADLPTAAHTAANITPSNLYPERRATALLAGASSSLANPKSSTALALIAADTKAILPGLLKTLPNAQPSATLYSPHNLHPLHPHRCPNLPPSPVRVFNADAFDTALAFPPSIIDTKPVLVLNMANAFHGGGGWLRGALAQEESMCYRSSLSFTLKRRFYPLAEQEAVYSPRVVVFRESLAGGHVVWDLARPDSLPVVSVVSVAAVRDPQIMTGPGGERYRYKEDEEAMSEKMRVVLRVAGRERHRRLVLGALGCGAFRNPTKDVVRLWRVVLGEREFEGWWESVVFAVMEDGETRDGEGNFGVFFRGLDGMLV